MAPTEASALQIVQEFLDQYGHDRPKAFAARIPLRVTGCDPEAMTMDFAVSIGPELENVWGVAHGGLLATIFDTCMGSTIRGLFALQVVKTVSLQVQYLRPVPIGAELLLRTRVLSSGRTLKTLTAECWLPGEERRPTNQATAAFYI